MTVPASSPGVLAAGDPARAAAGRAIIGSLLAGCVFTAYLWTAKELRPLYAHEPWQDDPYDAVVSFALICVPLLLAPSLLRVRLCRRYAELPARRAADLLRASRVLLGMVVITLGSEWVSVITGAHRRDWTAVTAALIGVLAVLTAGALGVAWLLRRAGRAARGPVPAQPDWLADGVTLGQQAAAWCGPWRERALAALGWLDRHVIAAVRRHPLRAAAVASAAGAVAADSPQIVFEGYRPGLALWFLAVTACALFAFLVAGGAYLRVTGRAGPAGPLARALVAAAAAVPVTAGFRAWLWWVVGGAGQGSGLARLALLTLVVPAATGALALAGGQVIRGARRARQARQA